MMELVIVTTEQQLLTNSVAKKEKAIETFDKACEMYCNMRSLFQAARMLEQAVLLSRDLGDLDGVVKFAERGALLFRQDGSNESAAQLLEKACKIVIRVIYFRSITNVI